MPRRRRAPGLLTRAQVVILVKQLLERAATEGMTKAQLVAAIGPSRTSPQTIQRALDELRERHEGQIRYSGRDQRWRLEAPLSMPLEAPERDDLLYQLYAEAMTKPLLGPRFVTRIRKIIEDVDDRFRQRGTPTDVPKHNAMTSTSTLASSIDLEILQRLHAACRRTAIRMRYGSPWKRGSNPPWQEIEPWAIRVMDGAVFLRAWSRARDGARTFRVAHIESVEDIADRKTATPRHSPPADPWEEDYSGFGIDLDRPGVAVIRFRGAIARWIARVSWHPTEQDVWLEPDDLLERTIAYRSCRELARRLASVIDGIESIEPRELREEVFGLFARSKAMSRMRRPKRST